MTAKSNRYPVTRRTPSARRSSPTDSQGVLFSIETLRAFLITLAIGAGSILLLSLAAYFYPDPDRITLPLGLIAAALTSFLGGVVAKKRTGIAPALCGLVNGMLLMGLMILLSFFCLPLSHGYSALISTLLHTAVLVLSVLGALAGAQKPKAATRSKRRKY